MERNELRLLVGDLLLEALFYTILVILVLVTLVLAVFLREAARV